MSGERRADSRGFARRHPGLVLLVVLVVLGAAAWVWLGRRDVTPQADGGGRAPEPVPAAPAGLTGPGSWVESRVRQDGSVAVQQWIRSEVPVESLQLTAADPDAFPGTVEARVVVRAPDGSRLAARGAVGTRTLDVGLRRPATELYLDYVLTGDVLSGETSTVQGRAVARVTAMDVVFAGESGPTTKTVTGPGPVLGAGCLSPAAGYDAPPSPCGAATPDGGWQVQLDGEQRHDRVIVQLDAPG